MDGVGESASFARGERDAIDDDFDMVTHLSIELDRVGELDDFTVHACTNESAPDQVVEEVAKLSLLIAHDRGKDKDTLVGEGVLDGGDHLFARLSLDQPVALGTMALADASEKDAKVVVDFGDGADGASRVGGTGLLLDADRGG